jgi:tetratricopeptide (TPR) repeat protein
LKAFIVKSSFTWNRMLKWFVSLLVLAAVAGYVWSRVVPAQVDRLYALGQEQYRARDYAGAAATLERAHKWNPWAPQVNTLLGWSYWRLGDAAKAERYFASAYSGSLGSEEAKIGLAFASLELHHVSTALELFRELSRRHPSDDELRAALSQAYSEAGENIEAAKVYEELLVRDPTNQKAQQALLGLYGYPEYRAGLVITPSRKPRPAQTEVFFRTHGESLQALLGSEWKDVYSVGVNLGPGRPQEFSSTASRDFATYFAWLQQIGRMNANTVRIYTILPPAFYQALRTYNNESTHQPLWLIQEVWIDDDVTDLYADDTEREFRHELTSTIDLLHGQGDVSYRRGHNYGVYTADVSRWVLAMGVGREVEPRLVLSTNAKHPSETFYKGRYVGLPNGSPSEAWFARMCDLAVSYEMETYNAQRPLTVVNWPPLDPIPHLTEANYVDELKIRKKLGEAIPAELPKELNDADAVSLDVARFRAEPPFAAGLFALFHVYQHWPDFLLYDPAYAKARDSEGSNPYVGYLRDLKKAYSGMPLLIGEYGLSTSIVPAHVHPLGWNNGGLTEKQQSDLLVRFSKNIRDSGCAGGIVFAWQDEWWKHVHDSFTADFERPWNRNPLWNNALDPEKHFGIVGYEPDRTVPLLRGQAADWAGATRLSSVVGPSATSVAGTLRTVYASSDFTYLYLRLDLAPGPVDWTSTNYWIALNTFPGETGSRQLPNIGVRLESGANFLIQLNGPASGRLLIAENYNPNRPFPVVGRSGQSRIWRKQGMQPTLANSAVFQDIIIEANPARYGRDGTEYPAINYDRSPLPYGSADRSSPEYSSTAMWNTHLKRGMIELRIPWGLLLVSDPSAMQVFAGTDQKWSPLFKRTSGISVAAFEVGISSSGGREHRAVSSSLPPLEDGVAQNVPVYTWQAWDRVQYRPYVKQSYFALQKVFGQLAGGRDGSGSSGGGRWRAQRSPSDTAH